MQMGRDFECAQFHFMIRFEIWRPIVQTVFCGPHPRVLFALLLAVELRSGRRVVQVAVRGRQRGC